MRPRLGTPSSPPSGAHRDVGAHLPHQVLLPSLIQMVTLRSSGHVWGARPVQTRSRALPATLTATSQCWDLGGHRPPETHAACFGQTPHLVPVSSPTGESPGAKPGLAPGYLVLIVVAVFALVTGTAAFLITRYQRMTGKYNFKTQADDFSYQVFYD